jgi:hypothetical protein
MEMTEEKLIAAQLEPRDVGYRPTQRRPHRGSGAQWLLFCMVHNIGKLQRFGDARAQ